jgi:membrane-associated protein
MHFDLATLIQQVGYIGIFAIVFAESGLLFGFFLPGDSLLFTAGFLASQYLPTGQPILNIVVLTVVCWIAAVTGDQAGYYIGRRMGRRLFEKENSRLFKKEHILKAQDFYEKHGGKTIILARFMPIIRTFAPVVAGAAHMKYSSFVFFNVIGGTIWTFGMCLGGYFLGRVIPDVDKYLLPIILVIIFLSLLPGALHFLKEKENRVKLKSLAHSFINQFRK